MSRRSPVVRRQAGIVLVLVLAVLVAMTLASIGLTRSIDTAQLLSGNIGFKRDVINRALLGLKGVAEQMTTTDFVDISKSYCQSGCPNNNERNYVPRLLETDAQGLPIPITNLSAFKSMYKKSFSDIANGVTTVYLIERMCSDYNDPSDANCIIDGATAIGGSQPNDSPGATPIPLFRVTVRADGPRNSLAYAQAIVSIRQK